MASYYIAATARIVDAETGEVINRGATITASDSRLFTASESIVLPAGQTTTFEISSSYQYWKAELSTGYTFVKWNVTTSDPSTSSLSQRPPASIDYTTNPAGSWDFADVRSRHDSSDNPLFYTVTLYVKVPSITITFDANGGVGEVPAPITLKAGSSFVFPDQVPHWTTGEADFAAWSAEGYYFIPGDTVTVYASGTFKAMYSNLPKVELIWDGVGGSPVPEPFSVRKEVRFRIPATVPVKAGFSFGGWDVEHQGNAKQPNEKVYIPSSWSSSTMTCYAIWNTGQFTITFDDAGGTGGPGVVRVTAGESYTIPSTPPTRESYTFSHWVSDSVRYDLGQTFTPNQNMLFVAIWTGGPIPPHPPRPESEKDFLVYGGSGPLTFSPSSGSLAFAV